MIEAQHLSKAYGQGAYALRDLSLVIDQGEFVFLTGPSGAGKSTLLRLLLCQERPSEGRLTVDGEDLSLMGPSETQAYRRHVGFVFQDFKLLGRMTVLENTAFVPRVMGAAPTVQRRKAERVLKWVGLEHRLDAYPSQLSGGEQQRVAIARALINDPTVVLADEPTGNLDPDLALEIMNLFREINARGTTVVVATHDRELIRQVGHRAILLEHGVITEESPALGDGSYFGVGDPDRTESPPAPVPARTASDKVSVPPDHLESDDEHVTALGLASIDDAVVRAEVRPDEVVSDDVSVAPDEVVSDDVQVAPDELVLDDVSVKPGQEVSDDERLTAARFASIDEALLRAEVEADDVSPASDQVESDDERVTATGFASIDDALTRADGEAHRDETG